jgi:uncharacterized protein (TIGR02246 family)
MAVTAGSIMTHEDQIRAVISGWIDAVRAKDSSRMVAGFVPDAYVFDVINPLKYIGIASVRQRVDQWLSSFAGPITYDVHDLRIVAGDEVAFCHSINTVKATKNDGKPIDMAWRTTVCFEKISGQRSVIHEHSSVPFDSATGLASLNLKP